MEAGPTSPPHHRLYPPLPVQHVDGALSQVPSLVDDGTGADAADVPAPFRGTAIALMTAGIMSLAFMGFSGIQL